MCYCLTSFCRYDICYFRFLGLFLSQHLSVTLCLYVFFFFFLVLSKKINRGGEVEKQIERMKSWVEWVSQCFFPVNFDSTFHNNTQCIILTKYCYVIYSKIIRYLKNKYIFNFITSIDRSGEALCNERRSKPKSVSLQVMKKPFPRIWKTFSSQRQKSFFSFNFIIIQVNTTTLRFIPVGKGLFWWFYSCLPSKDNRVWILVCMLGVTPRGRIRNYSWLVHKAPKV